jgi:hypothetical protein
VTCSTLLPSPEIPNFEEKNGRQRENEERKEAAQ